MRRIEAIQEDLCSRITVRIKMMTETGDRNGRLQMTTHNVVRTKPFYVVEYRSHTARSISVQGAGDGGEASQQAPG